MDLFDELELEDCVHCGGAGLLEQEGNCFYVNCLDCGCHTVNIDYRSEEDKKDAASRVALLWNTGKVISPEPGE